MITSSDSPKAANGRISAKSSGWPASDPESADEGINNRRRIFIAHAKSAFKQTGTGSNPGTINGEEQQNNQRRNNTQHAALSSKRPVNNPVKVSALLFTSVCTRRRPATSFQLIHAPTSDQWQSALGNTGEKYCAERNPSAASRSYPEAPAENAVTNGPDCGRREYNHQSFFVDRHAIKPISTMPNI